MKNEKELQSKFTKWLQSNGWTFAYELKVSKTNTLPFSKFQPQQLPSLYKAKHGILPIKYTDASLGMKNFDGVCLSHVEAYVGIAFDININNHEIYLLDIDSVMKLKEKQKSITKKDCETLGIKHSF